MFASYNLSTFIILVFPLLFFSVNAVLPNIPHLTNRLIPDIYPHFNVSIRNIHASQRLTLHPRFRFSLRNVQRSQGVSLDPCRDSSHCNGPRTCDVAGEPSSRCTDNDVCFCSIIPEICSSNEECSTGEVCIGLGSSTTYVCASKSFIDAINTILPQFDISGPGAPPSKDSGGLSLDNCRFSDDCKGSRSCGTIDNRESCDGDLCSCIPPTIAMCNSDGECVSGEVCVRTLLTPPVCFSEAYTDAANALRYVPLLTKPGEPLSTDSCFSNDTKSVQETQSRQLKTSGRTYSKCARSSDCRSSRACIGITKGGKMGCCSNDFDDGCFCVPPDFTSCSEDSDCSDREVCQNEDGAARFCKATDAISVLTPTNSLISQQAGGQDPPPDRPDQYNGGPPEENVCIGVHSLKHLSFRDLTFDKHRMANVLCDSNNSCATHGHMVWFHDKPMMMKSYCDIVGCSEKVMLVNSPRRKVGLRVKSETDGMQFSSFAASYGTGTEEGILGVVMRVGL